MNKMLRVLAIGDIVGRSGRKVLAEKINALKKTHAVDIIIANGENSAGGMAITPDTVKEIFRAGVNVITTGNHIWNNSEINKVIDEEPFLLRPANYPEGVRGKGYCIISEGDWNICVINLMGRIHMEPIDCPFRKFDEIYARIKDQTAIVIVDFHAEATSEKRALGWYADGRASAVFGTHTHVQTADEEILPKGTAYITDIGMTGSFDSVIGIEKDMAIEKLMKSTKVRFKVGESNLKLNGAVMEIESGGRAHNIYRIFE